MKHNASISIIHNTVTLRMDGFCTRGKMSVDFHWCSFIFIHFLLVSTEILSEKKLPKPAAIIIENNNTETA